MIKKGEWVEIEQVVLNPEDRAPSVPEDTKCTPLLMRVRGFLQADATAGDEAEVLTKAGRKISGRLLAANPAFDHTFGEPVPELLGIGPMLRRMISDVEA